MDKTAGKRKIEKLKNIINKYRYEYHVLDKSDMSDSAWDSLKHELWALEQEYPEFITPDSPTQRIGGAALDKFTKVKHKVAQWSFNDIFSIQELIALTTG